MSLFFALGWLLVLGRFAQLQILEYRTYKVLASDQHEIQSSLVAKRGSIFLEDRFDKALYPIARDRDAWEMYFVPREMKDVEQVLATIAELASSTSLMISASTTFTPDGLRARIKSPTSTYGLVRKDVPLDFVEKIRAARLPGVGFRKGPARMYPEQGIGGQVLGFVSMNDEGARVGRYGLEGYFQDALAGKSGELEAETDASGGRLAIGTVKLQPAENGADVVLTIDRTIQFEACKKAAEAVQRFEAKAASILVLDADSGAVLAMCSSPDFDPSAYGKTKDISVFNNPIVFSQYEPGSIFKPLTLAAGLDADKITPRTTYEDRGEETMDGFTIRNSDKKAHGIQTMTEVLEQSLNTGTIFVQRLIGKETFADYVKRFGFGTRTGIELPAEAKGNIEAVDKPGKIFAATASFGQGISATALQMAASYAALGNGGRLYKPFLVKEIRFPDGRIERTKPMLVSEPIRAKTSRLITGMMVNVVENGHGKRAAVPGYYVAGKTGTAQIPDPNGKGYLKDAFIGSFAGFAPADKPAFAMIVRIDQPTTVEFAESSAGPIFGEMAQFLLTYLQIPPERPIKQKQAPLPPSPVTTTKP